MWLLFHHDFIQVQAKYNIHRGRPGPSSYSRQMAGYDTEYEQNGGGIITNLHYINFVDKVEVPYKFTINGK